jgi:hypothetical protein
MEELQFKTIAELIEYLEGNEMSQEDIVAQLKEISSRRKSSGQRRGQLAGIALEDMTDEQLKRELINSKSVLYKAVQRGASEETIAKNQARVDAAVAEKEKRTPVAEEATEETATVDTDAVYNEDIAEEL